ncbi:MAG: hypothetical protein KGL53_13875, partial [Elusimicrobia bacterium]|nr:hypothetical protein [Elusimicrobiota bacterium]
MKRLTCLASVLALLALAASLPGPVAAEGKVKKVIGIVEKVEMIPAATSPTKAREAVATLHVHGKPMDILVRDEVTLKKFDIKKISHGDEVRVKYEETQEAGKPV